MTEYLLRFIIFVTGLALIAIQVLFDDYFTRKQQIIVSVIGATMIVSAFLPLVI